jgi:small subunit ribosomal protein S11
VSDGSAGSPPRRRRLRRRTKSVKRVRYDAFAIVHVRITFNNTLVNVSRVNGRPLTWSSGGACRFKFKGSRKKTPFASQMAARDAILQASTKGVRFVMIKIAGAGRGRQSAIEAMKGTGVRVLRIFDVTSLPHNGCRPPKKPRR